MKKEKRPPFLKKAEEPEVQAETSAERVPFEELIAGEYAEDFRRKAEEIRAETKGDPRTAYEALLHSAAAARQRYPDFDLRRELSDPRFAAMAARGIDAKAAYEAVHHDELLRSAMAYGVQRTAERLAAAKMAARPSENGADSQAASVSKVDPRSLSRAEREELRRRVIDRGERITF